MNSINIYDSVIMPVTSFKIPEKFVTYMDSLIVSKSFSSRGELIKKAILDFKEYYESMQSNYKSEKNKINSKMIEAFFTSY